MPSQSHEALLLLLRNRPQLVPELLRDALSATLPQYTDVTIGSADLTEVQPAEYRADLVLQLSREEPVLGIVVEVQLSVNASKRFAWPAYVTNLRSRWRCPVCLLVVCPDGAVAEWAGRPIPIGCTNMFVPRVLPLSWIPEITDEASAAKDPELTMLSAIARGKDADAQKAARTAAVALEVAAGLDADRAGVYFDLVLNSLSEAARKVLQETMRPAGYEYQSDFARRYVAEGRAEIVMCQLAARFGPLSEDVKAQIASSSGEELKAIAGRLLTAASLQEALAPKS